MKKRNILIYFAIAALIFLGQYLTFRNNENKFISRLKMDARTNVALSNAELSVWISQVLQEITFISTDDRVISYVTDPTPASQAEVSELFSKFSASTAIYDQVRLINMEGMEIVRVDYEEGGPVIIPSEDLQNKSDRDYFIESKDLALGGKYISALDLNIEYDEVEIPYKPVIRICTPVADESGNIKAILIFNYLASGMLDKFSSFDENLMLINNNGYWLKSRNPEDEWAFMFNKDVSMSTLYPTAWQLISSTVEGQDFTQDGLWTFSTVLPLKEAQETSLHLYNTIDERETFLKGTLFFWKVVHYITAETINHYRSEALKPILLSSLVFYPLAFWGIWNYNQRIELKKQSSERVRFMATHDMMTGLYNRAFFEAEISRLNTSREYPITIFMLDANNLKTINDSLGHPEGDQLLKNIAAVLKESFRTEDIIARLGGDEFAVLLPQTDAINSQPILERLQDNIRLFNKSDAVRKVDVAIGSATTDQMEDLNAVLKRADEKMYVMKISQKQKRKHSH